MLAHCPYFFIFNSEIGNASIVYLSSWTTVPTKAKECKASEKNERRIAELAGRGFLWMCTRRTHCNHLQWIMARRSSGRGPGLIAHGTRRMP